MNSIEPTSGRGHYPFLLLAFFFSIFSVAQTVEQTQGITDTYDLIKLNSLISGFEKEMELKKGKIKNIALFKEWGVSQKRLDGTVVALNDIGVDGTPLYYTTHMDPTSKVSRADALYSDGILDLGIYGKDMKVGVWDAGVARSTHQEFDTRVTNVDGGEIDNHGTLVTGAVVASGVKKNVKGVAYAAQALSHDWSRDKIEVIQAAANGLLLSNHSYGIKTDRVPDWYFGAYIKVAQDWDNIMYNAPYYLMVTAAGNAQNSHDNEVPIFGKTQDGFDLLVGFTTAKNGLVVAGADAEIDGKGNLKGAQVAGYSSFGPTDDGRIKPDLAGDGTLIHTTSATSNTSYSSSMGTSMAAPGVTGSLLLLQEYHEELYGRFMKSATLKGLALHTADDVKEPGPDYRMGWGVINTKKAAESLRNKDFNTLITEENLSEGETYTLTVRASGNEVLSASISWTDPEGEFVNRGDLNAPAAVLANDLDIRISKDGETYFPWKLNPVQATSKALKGDNLVDPFERIDILNADGEYTISISHKGNLRNSSQDFSLIISGVALTSCKLEPPTEIDIAAPDGLDTAIQWKSNGLDTLYELQLKSERGENWETYTTWDNFFPLQDLILGMNYSARVRAVCSQNLTSEFSEEIAFLFNGEETVLEAYEPLSVREELSIKVYPNPVINELQVETELSDYAIFSIISTNGTTLKSGKLDNIININVADLSTGLYALVIRDLNGIKSTKFFKD
ncbi:MAG: S8 family serine peptidase [Bacteroidota bacterium]